MEKEITTYTEQTVLEHQPLGDALLKLLEKRLSKIEKALTALREELEERPAIYSVQIFDLGMPSYRLRYPLLVTVERYPEEVVARLPQFDLYASAEGDSLALSKLKAELVDTYERLERLGVDKLGPLPRQWLDALRALVERINA